MTGLDVGALVIAWLTGLVVGLAFAVIVFIAVAAYALREKAEREVKG